jgi:cobalt-zinc-cadmium efflux system protein
MTNINQNTLHTHDDHHHPHYFLPFVLILIFAIVEVVGGLWTESLALLSDAAHMFSDVGSLALAWLASVIAHRSSAARHRSGVSFAELAVSIVNVITMLLVIVWVTLEAIARFKHPHQVQGFGLMLISTLGLVVNVVVAKLMHQHALHEGASLNARAAFLHVVGDLLGSLAAVLAGVVIYFTGWMLIDPILSLFISILLLFFTLNLMRDIWQTLRSGASVVQHTHSH